MDGLKLIILKIMKRLVWRYSIIMAYFENVLAFCDLFFEGGEHDYSPRFYLFVSDVN